MKKWQAVLVYVDDVLFFSTTDAIIDKMIANLKKDFDLKVEEDVFAFLEIKIIQDKKGNMISLWQRGLVDEITKAMGMEMRIKHRFLLRRLDLVPMSVVVREGTMSGAMPWQWGCCSIWFEIRDQTLLLLCIKQLGFYMEQCNVMMMRLSAL